MNSLVAFGVPLGPELVIVFGIAAFFLVVPSVIIVAIFSFLDWVRGYERRIEDLERRVSELENE